MAGGAIEADEPDSTVDSTSLIKNEDTRPGTTVQSGTDTYKFERAVYIGTRGRRPVDDMAILSSTSGGFFGIRLYDSVLGEFDSDNTAANPNEEINYRNYGYYSVSDGTKDNSGNSVTIELIYQKDPPPKAEDNYKDPDISKKAILKDDGTYDLSLQVAGEEIVPPVSNKMDVLFVLDGSGSMSDSWGTTSRQEALVAAVKDLVEEIEDRKKD